MAETEAADEPRRIANRVFISYSRRDQDWLDRLLMQLAPLRKAGTVDLWIDQRGIEAGDNFRGKIEEGIDTSAAAILLVTADFQASDFINENELPRLRKAADAGDLKLFWIPVNHCVLADELADTYHTVGNPQVPLEEQTKGQADKILADLARELKRYCDQKVAADQPAPAPQETAPPDEPTGPVASPPPIVRDKPEPEPASEDLPESHSPAEPDTPASASTSAAPVPAAPQQSPPKEPFWEVGPVAAILSFFLIVGFITWETSQANELISGLIVLVKFVFFALLIPIAGAIISRFITPEARLHLGLTFLIACGIYWVCCLFMIYLLSINDGDVAKPVMAGALTLMSLISILTPWLVERRMAVLAEEEK